MAGRQAMRHLAAIAVVAAPDDVAAIVEYVLSPWNLKPGGARAEGSAARVSWRVKRRPFTLP
jgi:hypothetical protein